MRCCLWRRDTQLESLGTLIEKLEELDEISRVTTNVE